MNQPVIYNFPDFYKDSGLRKIVLRLTYPKTGNPVDLTEAVVRMQLRGRSLGNLVFEFSTEPDGDALLTIPNGIDGKIEFPVMNSWNITASEYKFDIKVTDKNGMVSFYVAGLRKVNPNVTKPE